MRVALLAGLLAVLADALSTYYCITRGIGYEGNPKVAREIASKGLVPALFNAAMIRAAFFIFAAGTVRLSGPLGPLPIAAIAGGAFYTWTVVASNVAIALH